QIVGMSVFCVLVLLFYCFPGILLGNRIAEITVNSIFSFVAVSSALLFIRCSAIDPGDQTRFRFRNKRTNRNKGLDYCYIFSRILLRFMRSVEKKILRTCIRRKYLDPLTTRIQMEPIFPFQLVQPDDSVTPNPKNDGISFCYLCDFEVNRYSKHCRSCNRCVEGFDHHCRWLNNCVGKKNYSTFFLLMVLVLTMLVLEAGASLAVFIRCFADSKAIEEELNSRHYRKFPRSAIATICVFIVVITCYAMAALGQLLFFHVLLIKKGISTYDFILAMKEENKSLGFESSLEEESPSSSSSSDVEEDEDEAPEKSLSSSSWRMMTACKSERTMSGEKKKKKKVVVSIDPWKLSKLEKRDPLKPLPLPLEMKSGLLIKPDGCDGGGGDSCLNSSSSSPGRFSSPRKRVSSSPKEKYKNDFDLKLTRVSREMETHISRQLLTCVLKKQQQ
ncbi:hypothetical protein M569_08164, partial [Genlisea aurea]